MNKSVFLIKIYWLTIIVYTWAVAHACNPFPLCIQYGSDYPPPKLPNFYVLYELSQHACILHDDSYLHMQCGNDDHQTTYPIGPVELSQHGCISNERAGEVIHAPVWYEIWKWSNIVYKRSSASYMPCFFNSYEISWSVLLIFATIVFIVCFTGQHSNWLCFKQRNDQSPPHCRMVSLKTMYHPG